MKKKLILVCISLLLVAAIISCGGSKKNDAQALLDSVPFTKEGLVSMIKSAETLTDTEYEAMILAYSKCEIDEATLDLKTNPISEARSEIYKTRKAPAEENIKTIQTRLLSHESPQVRGYLVGNVSSFFGVNKEDRQVVLDMLKAETNPYVVKTGVRTLGNEMKDPAVAEFIFAQAKSDNPVVRAAAANAIGNSWSKGVGGTTEAIITLMNDADQSVRGAAAYNSGKLADEKVIPELEKILNNPNEHKIHSKAIDGLCDMWFHFPFHENTSKAAYDATLNYLRKTPRTEDYPSSSSVSSFKTFNEDKLPEWEKKATYFSRPEVAAVMVDIAGDTNVGWMTRKSAVGVIAVYGTKADLEKALKTAEANEEAKGQSHVISAIKDELGKK